MAHELKICLIRVWFVIQRLKTIWNQHYSWSQNDFSVCFVIQNLEKSSIEETNSNFMKWKNILTCVCFVVQHLEKRQFEKTLKWFINSKWVWCLFCASKSKFQKLLFYQWIKAWKKHYFTVWAHYLRQFSKNTYALFQGSTIQGSTYQGITVLLIWEN